jgi:hypothetical protein
MFIFFCCYCLHFKPVLLHQLKLPLSVISISISLPFTAIRLTHLITRWKILLPISLCYCFKSNQFVFVNKQWFLVEQIIHVLTVKISWMNSVFVWLVGCCSMLFCFVTKPVCDVNKHCHWLSVSANKTSILS